MAKAKRNIQVESVPVTTYVDKPIDKGVILELNQDEAQFLADILGRIGGSPISTRRKHQESISGALAAADVRAQYPVRDMKGSMIALTESEVAVNYNPYA